MDNRKSLYYIGIRICAEAMCDKIADLMAYNFDDEFSVCIKLIDVASSRITRSADQVNLITFCRGGKDKGSRSDQDAEKISLRANSDFLSIFHGASHFSTGNLRAYELMNGFLLEAEKLMLIRLKTIGKSTYQQLLSLSDCKIALLQIIIVLKIKIRTNY